MADSSSGARHSAPSAAPKANPAQLEAIHVYTGETLVLAGPGSGKTYVLTAHIETLIETYHVDPSSILVLTFSKAAALSMRSRFYKNTEGRYPPIAFGTFHSIFYQIIRNGGDDKATLIAPARRQRLLRELLRMYFPEMTDPDDTDILSEVICRSREQGRPCPKGDCKNPAAIARAVCAYEAYLAENHLIDYDGMILLCRDLLRNDPELLRRMQAQYSFLLVDEFQDISAAQYEILRMLYDRITVTRDSSDHTSEPDGEAAPRALFVVGDDDQSIYGFRGSSPSICRDFLRDYPDARQILLSINYRSVPSIVRTAGLVIEQNKNRIPKRIVSGKASSAAKQGRPGAPHPATPDHSGDQKAASGHAVVCKSFTDRTEQWNYLVKVVAAMDIPARKETAIICRTNRQLRFIREALARSGLFPMEYAVPENPWIQRVHTLYQGYMAMGTELRQDHVRQETYRQIMNVPERFLLRESMPRDHMSRRDLLSVYPRGSAAWNAMASLIECAERLCDLPEGQRVRFFRMVIGIEADLIRRANGKEEARQQIAEAFLDLQTNPGRVVGSGNAAAESRNKSTGAVQPTDSVALLTMHACKGLEYAYVYLPDLNEGMIPTRKAHSADAIEEERRLFYVAMTRAKEHLELLYVSGTAENPATPTRFLLPLGIGPRYTS